MKKSFLGVVLTLCFTLPASADLKIAVVDTGRAFDLYYKTKEMATRIAHKEASFKKEIQDMQAEYRESDKEAQGLDTAAKDRSLPDDIRKLKDSALGIKVENLKSMADDLKTMSRQRRDEIQDDLVRSHKEISEQIQKVVQDYAGRLGYDLVLDNSYDTEATISRMPYRSVKVFDITEAIITKLNASAPPAPPAGAPAASAEPGPQ